MAQPFCLIKEKAQAFIDRLKNGEISPEKMNAMSSAERKDYFKSFLSEEETKQVNLLFERKILNKNRESGLIAWAEQVSGKNTKQRDALVTTIKKNTAERDKRLFSPEDEKAFLNDLVEQRLGIGVSHEESKAIFELSKKFQETRDLFNKSKIHSKLEEIKGSLTGNERKLVDELISKLEDKELRKGITSKSLSRIKNYLGEGASEEVKKNIDKLVDDIVSSRKNNSISFGASKVALDEYIGDIKLGIKNPRTILSTIKDIASFSKSVLASVDNSFIGRQGLKTLFSGNPKIWFNTFKQSFETLYKSGIKGEDALRGIKAEILSRKN